MQVAVKQRIEFAKAPPAGCLNQAYELKRFLEFLSESASDSLRGRQVAILLPKKVGEWPADCFQQIDEVAHAPGFEWNSWVCRNGDRAKELLAGEPTILTSPARSLLLLPVVSRAGLESLLCVELDGQASGPTLKQGALLRRVCRQAGAAIAELRESDSSRTSGLAKRMEEVQKTLAELRREKEQLERVAQISSYVLSNTIHELRTPLVAVRGYARMLLEERAGPVNAAQRQYLKIVLENATKMVGLLQHLQNLPAACHLRLQMFDVRELWQQAIEPLRPRAAQKSITIIEQVAGQPLTITGDPEKLGFVLQRLLFNAIKFTHAGGEIRADLHAESDHVVIRISDTGDGIPPEFTDEMFDRGEHSDVAPSPSPAQDAWERSPVHEIVRMHGGRISVTSALGEGCLAVLTLPLIHFTSAETGARHETSGSGR